MVRLEKVSVVIGKKQILNDISCTFLSKPVSVLIGKSGAGKTTLLQAIAGLIPLHEGKIFVEETQVSSLSPAFRAKKIGYVFQQFNLFPHMSVKENCIDPLLVHGVLQKEAESRAIALLSQFGLHDIQDKYPAQLSGGQQQRVAIIRALLLEPQVLLLDEPTASLDPENTNILIGILKKLAQKGLTIIISSQDGYFTKRVADSLVLVEEGLILARYDSLQDAEKDKKTASFLV